MTICGVAIVKDEADNIAAMLRAPVDDWVIVDTGSTDGRRELGARGLSPRGPWVDFGHNRTKPSRWPKTRPTGCWRPMPT